MEGIFNLASFQKFETEPTTIGIKIVTPISGVEKFTIKLVSAGRRESFTLMPETVPFCAHLKWICNRVEATAKRKEHQRLQLLFN